ncbi:MAG: hypothetical protein J6U10_04855 [Lachnospiraceae bacterium]|nr:hypothetical protein [Lachnospiraceae bacterium]
MDKTVIRKVIAGVVLVCLFAGVLFVQEAFEHRGFSGGKIKRPTDRESVTETLSWQVLGDEAEGTGSFSVKIGKQIPDPEDIQGLLEYGREYLLEKYPEGTPVYGDLRIPENVPGTQIKIVWEAAEYTYINIDGSRRKEVTAEDGERVELKITLSVYGEETNVDTAVVMMPRSLESTFEERLKERIEYLESSTNEAWLELPREFEGVELMWGKPESFLWLRVLFLIPVVPAAVLLLDREKRKEKQKKREKQLMAEYPEVVSKFLLLLESGLTVSAAWGHVVAELPAEGDANPVYKEMRMAYNEMENGVSEVTACENFGKRCGILPYMRFAGLLSQNLTKGSESVFPLLEQEVLNAFAERKEAAKKAGEEAGTKLLIPMTGLLMVVLALIMFAAFGNI